ncbi:MAG TPA: autotransporter-associated beta strand repeat-containing protein [Opitutus sp.]|nr:autotransporter-associated beta strand repeat-containing protein [Opitutus sp.]
MKRPPAPRLIVFAVLAAACSALRADNPPEVWTGKGADDVFSTDANWQDGSAPTGSGTENIEFGDTSSPFVFIAADVALNDLKFDYANDYSTYYSYYFFGSGDVPKITLNGGIYATDDDTSRGAYFGPNLELVLSAGAHQFDTPGLYLAFDGLISGTGSIVKDNAGSLVLWNGSNSFSGGVTINNGWLGLGAEGAAGTGPISLFGAGFYSSGIYNAGNGDLTIDNSLVLGPYATFENYYGNTILNGSVTPSATSSVSILAYGSGATYFNGDISGSGVAYHFYFDGTGAIALQGHNTYDGGTYAESGALVFGTAQSIPSTGSIHVAETAYAGVAAPGALDTFLARLDKNDTLGGIGIDSDPSGGTNTFGNVDLTDFNNQALLFGSASLAVLSGTFTPPAGAQSYNFGGRGALIFANTSPLEDVDGSTTRDLRAVTFGSGSEPFVLVLRGAGTSTYTGGTNAESAGIIFDSLHSVPATGDFNFISFTYMPGGYIGITENAGINGSPFGVTDLVDRIANSGTHPGNSVIGFDSHEVVENHISGDSVTTTMVVNNLDLSSINGPLFVGTVTKATLTGSLTTTGGGSDNYFFTGYKGGELDVEADLTDGEGPRSATIGLPQIGQSEGSGTVRIGSGANTYTGDTVFQSGELYLDASTNGPSGDFDAGPIGTGALRVQPYSGSVTLGFGVTPNQFANDIALQYGELHIETNNGGGLTMSGAISGGGELVFETANPVTLSHANTYDGGTTLFGADVTATNNTALGAGLVDLENGSTLTFTAHSPHIYGLTDNNQKYSPATNTVYLSDTTTLTIDAPPVDEPAATDVTARHTYTPYYNFSGDIIEYSTSLGHPPGGTHSASLPATSGASIVKVGDSVETFYGNNTYSGGTTINGGVIVAGSNSALGTGPVTINSGASGGLGTNYGVTVANDILFGANGGVLGGFGTFTATNTIVIGTNAHLNPGDHSPGELTFTNNLGWSGGGYYEFNVQQASGTAGAGYDLLNITGQLTFTATTVEEAYPGGPHASTLTTPGPFTLNVYSLDGSGSQGLLADFDPNHAYSWTIVHTTRGFNDGGAPLLSFPSGSLILDTSFFEGYNNLNGGSFSLSISGNDLLLNFNPAAVPEPSTWALLLCGLAALGLFARRAAPRRK